LKSIFTISLDFELHWGGFEKWPLQVAGHRPPIIGNNQPSTFNQYFLNTRKAIPQMLDLFKNYEAHVTWATVGMLLHNSREELVKNAPVKKPTYTVPELSAYHYIDHIGIGEDEKNDPFHYAPSLVKQILNTPYQELGTHTYGHYYCNEACQTVEQFREDLRAAQRAAHQYGLHLRSLVFPRNQFNDAYLRVCFEEGITSVRSNPVDWFWKIDSTLQESAWKRLNRGLDAYLNVGKKNSYPINSLQVRDGYPVCLPASRLLRPYNPKEWMLNELKIKRIKNEMTEAARKGEVYHVWWHPHNFGNYPEQSLAGLTKILKHFSYCREKFNMQSMNMGEITSVLRHGN